MNSYIYRGVKITKESKTPASTGGQSAGIMYKGITMKCELIEVTVNCFNSQIKNLEQAKALIELGIDSLFE